MKNLNLRVFFLNLLTSFFFFRLISVVMPGYWPLEVAEEPVPFPNDNSVKSNNGGNELQRDEVKSVDRKEERNTPVGGIFFLILRP